MSTKQNSNSSAQFNPTAMQGYNAMQGPATQGLSSNISDPYSNMLFNTQLGMGSRNNAMQTSSALGAQQQNWQARGMNSSSPAAMFMNQNLVNQGRSNQASMFNNLLLQAGNFRQNSIQGAMNYRPLQTGQNNQQTTSGTGTWLPQVIAAGMSAASTFIQDKNANAMNQVQGPGGETRGQILDYGAQTNQIPLGAWGPYIGGNGLQTGQNNYGIPGPAPDIGGWPSAPTSLPQW
jgi:hypothetical protein